MIATAPLHVRQWLSPPQIARERGIRTSKVLAWINSGELAAVNHATRRGGRPRWRISRAALDAFDTGRCSLSGIAPKSSRRKPTRDHSVVEFF